MSLERSDQEGSPNQDPITSSDIPCVVDAALYSPFLRAGIGGEQPLLTLQQNRR